jgi:PAS domain-containing protein
MGDITELTTKNGISGKGNESVAAVLEREAESITKEWLRRINSDENLCAIELDDKTRSSRLGQLFKDLVRRLRNPLSVGTKGERSNSAHQHGLTRRKQGYSAAMLVDESRILQVSVFDTLNKNVTEGRRANEQLRRNKERYYTILQTSIDAVLLT